MIPCPVSLSRPIHNLYCMFRLADEWNSISLIQIYLRVFGSLLLFVLLVACCVLDCSPCLFVTVLSCCSIPLRSVTLFCSTDDDSTHKNNSNNINYYYSSIQPFFHRSIDQQPKEERVRKKEREWQAKIGKKRDAGWCACIVMRSVVLCYLRLGVLGGCS